MLNRTVCDMIEEARQCCKTANYSYLPALLEEIQSAANRMEAALWDQKEYRGLKERAKKLKRKIRKLEKKAEELEK